MDTKHHYHLEHYVKDIFVLENKTETKQERLPFFADGHPGLMFHQSQQDIIQLPKNKKLSSLIIYGQTLEPMEISARGVYRMIVFQLYPFAVKTLFGINLKQLNDDCFDLLSLQHNDISTLIETLASIDQTSDQINNIAAFLHDRILKAGPDDNLPVKLAINLIVNSKGKIPVKSIAQQLHITERTLQRQFLDYVGISPKQFSQVIKFHSSLDDLSDEVFQKLTDLVYENGYADQSHFIRNFKRFTGKKPSEFKSAR